MAASALSSAPSAPLSAPAASVPAASAAGAVVAAVWLLPSLHPASPNTIVAAKATETSFFILFFIVFPPLFSFFYFVAFS